MLLVWRLAVVFISSRAVKHFLNIGAWQTFLYRSYRPIIVVNLFEFLLFPYKVINEKARVLCWIVSACVLEICLSKDGSYTKQIEVIKLQKGDMIRLLDNDEAVAGMLYGAAEGTEDISQQNMSFQTNHRSVLMLSSHWTIDERTETGCS